MSSIRSTSNCDLDEWTSNDQTERRCTTKSKFAVIVWYEWRCIAVDYKQILWLYVQETYRFPGRYRRSSLRWSFMWFCRLIASVSCISFLGPNFTLSSFGSRLKRVMWLSKLTVQMCIYSQRKKVKTLIFWIRISASLHLHDTAWVHSLFCSSSTNRIVYKYSSLLFSFSFIQHF